MREANARREDGGRPEEPPGLQFLRAPERWGEAGEWGSWWALGGRGPRSAVSRGEGREGGEAGKEEPGEAWSWGRRERGAREKGLRAPPGHAAAPASLCPPRRGRAEPPSGLPDRVTRRPPEPHSVRVTEGRCVSFCLESPGTRGFVWILALGTVEPKMLPRWAFTLEAPAFSMSVLGTLRAPLLFFQALLQLITGFRWGYNDRG